MQPTSVPLSEGPAFPAAPRQLAPRHWRRQGSAGLFAVKREFTKAPCQVLGAATPLHRPTCSPAAYSK